MVHETKWFPKTTGAPSPKGGRPSVEWAEPLRGCTTNGGVSFFCSPMATAGDRWWRSCTCAETCSRPSSEAASGAMPATFRNLASRSDGMGVPERHVDPEADRAGDSEGIRSKVRSRPCLEALASFRLELPSTGEESNPTRRRGDRALETVPVAAAKKNGEDLVPTSRSLMRVGFCSSQAVEGRGESVATRRLFATTIVTTGFPHWLPSQSRDVLTATASTLPFSQRTSRRWTRLVSSAPFCGNSVDTSSLSGTMAAYTAGRSSARFKSSSIGFTWNTFLAMLPSSTPSSKSGTISNSIPPTLYSFTKTTSAATWIRKLGLFAASHLCYAHWCEPRIFHLCTKVYFHYLCETL